MRSDDVKLIQRILAGDENAFATLIEKYQRQVHALAFRKVRDFQTAEDITQETFLRVHQKLATLNDPHKVFRVAVCDCESSVYCMVPKKSVTDRGIARDLHLRNRDRGIFSVYCEGTCENNCRSATRLGQKTTYQVERE